jgi:two-component system response regulator NreC
MPETSGIEAVSVISKKDPKVKVIFLSMYGGEDYVYHCLKSGGSGLIHKNVNKQELLHAIELVTEGKKYFGKEYSEEEIEKLIADYESQTHFTGLEESEPLTSKEEEILLLIAEGLTSTEIAERLYITKRTVDTHRTHIMLKLKLNSFPELIKYAMSYSTLKNKKSH